ncbi:hypothetical protein M6B38_331985 [Iris pallida]|uniref:Uncharacterized protein n=1 Tax=Iris pallida TaxID=29817 RepID=A0AAX6DKG1_IRIPA|nr:hypothetical protein M6B38_240695 [Iris pallida]KAJ6835484.1 hypothetical protein M6B38_331985 [Iris pallida]
MIEDAVELYTSKATHMRVHSHAGMILILNLLTPVFSYIVSISYMYLDVACSFYVRIVSQDSYIYIHLCLMYCYKCGFLWTLALPELTG